MNGYMDERGILIDHKVVEGEHFSDLPVRKLTVANGSTLVRTVFEGLNIRYGSLGGGRQMSEYVDCRFERCHLELEAPGAARLIRCQFASVELVNWFCLNAEFIDCSFSGRLRKVVFDAALRPMDQVELGRPRNRYENNDFRKCTFRDVAFRGGIELDPALLPEEHGGIFLPDAAEAYSAALQQVEAHKNQDVRQYAGAFLRVRLDGAVRGQRQDYIAPADLRSRNQAINEVYVYVRQLLTPFDPRQ
jgi:hypothetical protein